MVKKNIKKNRRKRNAFEIVALSFIFWIVLFLIVAIFILARDPVSFSIGFQKNEVKRGENLFLNYTVSNTWPKEITNVTVIVEVIGRSDLKKEFHYNNAELFNKINGIYLIDTSSFPYGNYTIKTELHYLRDGKEAIPKELTLGFRVI